MEKKKKDIHLNTEIRIYKCTVRPVKTNGCETWSLTMKMANYTSTFERKEKFEEHLAQNRRVVWRYRRYRHNHELHEQYKELLYWTLSDYYRVRMEEQSLSKMVLGPKWKGLDQVEDTRRDGRRKLLKLWKIFYIFTSYMSIEGGQGPEWVAPEEEGGGEGV